MVTALSDGEDTSRYPAALATGVLPGICGGIWLLAGLMWVATVNPSEPRINPAINIFFMVVCFKVMCFETADKCAIPCPLKQWQGDRIEELIV
jgi:hypothetical protein